MCSLDFKCTKNMLSSRIPLQQRSPIGLTAGLEGAAWRRRRKESKGRKEGKGKEEENKAKKTREKHPQNKFLATALHVSLVVILLHAAPSDMLHWTVSIWYAVCEFISADTETSFIWNVFKLLFFTQLAKVFNSNDCWTWRSFKVANNGTDCPGLQLFCSNHL